MALVAAAKRKREREKEMLNKPFYILYPESKWVTAKDTMSFVALLLTFIVVPFEVSFVDAPPVPDPTDALWIFNRVVDLLFMIDICAQFFVSYPLPSKFLHEAKENGMDEEEAAEIIGTTYEIRMRYIFLDYLQGW